MIHGKSPFYDPLDVKKEGRFRIEEDEEVDQLGKSAATGSEPQKNEEKDGNEDDEFLNPLSAYVKEKGGESSKLQPTSSKCVLPCKGNFVLLVRITSPSPSASCSIISYVHMSIHHQKRSRQ